MSCSRLAQLLQDRQKEERTVTHYGRYGRTLMLQVHRIEGVEGILADWSLPGEHAAAAAYDVARTVCRRAECLVVRLAETENEAYPQVVAYLIGFQIFSGYSEGFSNYVPEWMQACETRPTKAHDGRERGD